MLIQSLLCVLSSVFFSQENRASGRGEEGRIVKCSRERGGRLGGGAILFSIFVGAADKSLWLVTHDGNDAS